MRFVPCKSWRLVSCIKRQSMIEPIFFEESVIAQRYQQVLEMFIGKFQENGFEIAG